MSNVILQRLIDMDTKKRLHHGFLFIGSGDNATKLMQSTVMDFTTYLFSKESSKELVERKLASSNHPDFFKLNSEDGDIKIEQIRELQKWLSIPPLESQKKIAVIEHAQHLTSSCANALLKTLEEPPSFALIVLKTNSISRMLPTIRSRLFSIQFPDKGNMDAEEKKEWIDELEKMLLKNSYTDKDIFSFTEKFSDKREELIFIFNLIHITIRNLMIDSTSKQFNHLEKMFTLALDLELELYQNFGNITLGLDRFLMEWRNT